ncbi:bifunctional adenosylcobinamide kinase/adenosylcobinamide-phosphate guanylyltransferase [Halobacillus andaensis]|uniref:bifunctional adenosylcobinamide kinase/adenosylcobinamide-phosphate guanylyltransferase n=1 Tax=Halobacillus andaensis TaxID=1176239 RepID=UPI003D723339
MITFICGGVRSGKTSYAEQLVCKSPLEDLHYIATGVVTDEEMKARIYHHRQDRKNSTRKWTTWEQPTDIMKLTFSGTDAVLLDCITTWVTNEMMKQDGWNKEELTANLVKQLEELIHKPGDIVVVSNEVSRDVPSTFSLVKDYAYVLGKVNQWLVDQSDGAVEMVFGEPIIHKEVYQ